MTTPPPASSGSASSPRRRGLALLGWVALAVVVVTLVALSINFFASPSQAETAAAADGSSTEWFTVEPQSFRITVTESGDLDAASRLEIKSKVEGRPEIIYLVEEGSEVKKDQVLVRLDSDGLKTDIEEATLNTEKARADEVYARRGLEIQRSEAASSRAAAGVALALAELELAKWIKGDVPQRRRELALELQKAQRLVERTIRDYTISQQLYDKKFISLNDLEDSEIERLEANDGLLTAELALSVYDDYTYKTEEQKNRSAVDQAQSDLENEIAKAESEIARLEADLSSKTQTLAIREERLANLQRQLTASEIVAPEDGIVIYGTSVGRSRYRNDPMAEGRQVRYNETILFLPDIRQMVANLSVAEAYEPLVKVGQTVRVTVDARPGEVFIGTIDRTTPLTESGGWLNPGQREFVARVLLPAGAEAELKPAMRCTGEITVGQVEDSLAVPVQAVFTEGEHHFVHLSAANGYLREQSVTLGRASETLVEVTDGLTAGDRVLLRNPRPGEVRG